MDPTVPELAGIAGWRMQIAAGLLSLGALTVAQVAERVGYESEASFGRAFKRGTGMAPSEWRRSGHFSAGDGPKAA